MNERMFADWTMGFRDVSDPDLRSLPSFTPFQDLSFTPKETSLDTAACLDVFNFFKNSR